MDEKLQPCPFCGAAGELPKPDYAGTCWLIWCSECSCEGHEAETKEEAIAIWNRRTPGPATAKMARYIGVIVRHSIDLGEPDNEPVEIRTETGSTWITIGEAKDFIDEVEGQGVPR